MTLAEMNAIARALSAQGLERLTRRFCQHIEQIMTAERCPAPQAERIALVTGEGQGLVFSSEAEAAEATGISALTIRDMLRGQRTEPLHGLFFRYLREDE
jgi:hypothetical protein